jgi:hypothetical protein
LNATVGRLIDFGQPAGLLLESALADAATFQIAPSGIRTPPDWPPYSALAVGFSGVALARRRCRSRGRRR